MEKQDLEMIELGCLLVMAAYHTVLYFQVRRKYYLYLGLLCFIVLLRATLVYDGSQLFTELFPSVSRGIRWKIEYLASYAALPLLPMFIFDLFPIKVYQNYLRFFQICGATLMALVLVTPHRIFLYSLNIYHLLMVAAFVLVFVMLWRAMKRRKVGAKAIFWGLAVCFVFVAIEMLKNSGAVKIDTGGPNLVNTGVVSYLFFQSVALSTIFAKSFTENQQLTRELEEKVAARTEQLSKSNLVKDRFIQVVSHDLRSPLGNLKATVDLLQSGTISEKDSKQLLEKINKRVDQSLGMLDDMLEWSKVSVSKVSMEEVSINLNELIEDAVDLAEENAYAKEIALKFVTKEQLHIDADKNAVQVIIRNLLSNAIKFTPRGGSVTLILDKAEGQVRVKVIDSGIGIPDDMKATLFDMERKNSRAGTEQEQSSGVGLALCRDLIQQIGGRITVDDNPGASGTVFTCWFKMSSPAKTDKKSHG